MLPQLLPPLTWVATRTLSVSSPPILAHQFLPTALPFPSVLLRVTLILVARNPEHTAVLDLLREWEDVKVEQSDLALVPVQGWVGFGSTVLVRHLLEQALVPASVYMPVLHGMRHVRRLNQVLDHDGRLAVGVGQFVGLASWIAARWT